MTARDLRIKPPYNIMNYNRIDYYRIFRAIREDDAKALKKIMLEYNIDANHGVLGGAPLLVHAIIYNMSPKVANLLLSLGADPNIYYTIGSWNMTPLMIATNALNVTAVRFLLKNGANPTLKSKDEHRESAYDIIKQSVDNMRNTTPRELRERIEAIEEMLRPIDPKELRSAKRALKPHTRNIMGSLSVRSSIPASVVSKEILPFLSTKYTRKRQGSPKSSRSPKSSTRRTSL